MEATFRIYNNGGSQISNCYNSNSFVIVSIKKLDQKDIKKLYDIGLLGCGQECNIVESSFVDEHFNYKVVTTCDSSD